MARVLRPKPKQTDVGKEYKQELSAKKTQKSKKVIAALPSNELSGKPLSKSTRELVPIAEPVNSHYDIDVGLSKLMKSSYISKNPVKSVGYKVGGRKTKRKTKRHSRR